MSNLKCPFCQQEYVIHKDDSCFGQQRCVCRNPNCEFDGWHFPIKLVSELIRTRKALEIAIDALKYLYDTNDDYVPGFAVPCGVKGYAKQKIDEITAILDLGE